MASRGFGSGAGYERAFLQRSVDHLRYAEAETETTENVILPMNECENDENTVRLHEKKIQVKSAPKTPITSSRIVSHSEWNELLHQKSTTCTLPTPKFLSTVLKQVPLPLQNGKLSLVGSYLTDIDQLPEKLSSLVRILFLSNNSLTSLGNLQQFSYLTTLSLTNNSIRYLHQLCPLSSLPFLEKISLEGNVVTHMPYYREILIGLCSGSDQSNQFRLKCVDSLPLTREEKEKSRLNFRKCSHQIEQIRCDCLRVTILEHMHLLFACHAELIRLVMGKFRNLLGSHIDINSSSRVALVQPPVVASTLRYALSGGVFRWLQISGGRSFEIQTQDICYRTFLASFRTMSSSKKSAILEQPLHMTAHWDLIVMECSLHLQKCMRLMIEKCETSSEHILTAAHISAGSAQDNFRRSQHFENDFQFGVQKFSVEQGEKNSLFATEAIPTIQNLHFIGTDLFHDALLSAMKYSNSSANNIFTEIQQTYCGFGLHYHSEPRSKIVRPAVSHQRTSGAIPVTQEPSREESNFREQKYETLLRNRKLIKLSQRPKNGTYSKNIQHGESLSPHLEIPESIGTQGLVTDKGQEPSDTPTEPRDTFKKPWDTMTEPTPDPEIIFASPSDLAERSLDDQKRVHHVEGDDLFSPIVFTLLNSPSLNDVDLKNNILPDASQHLLCFNNSELPLPELISKALINSIKDSVKDPPTEIVGCPPLPLSQFPNLSQANMKSLTSIFEEHLREIKTLDLGVAGLWTQRKNLSAGCEKVYSKLNDDITIALSSFNQYLRKIAEAKREVAQFRQLLPSIETANQRTTQSQTVNIQLVERINCISIEYCEVFEDLKRQHLRKDGLAATTEEGLNSDLGNGLTLIVIAAVSAMNDEIYHSAEIQSNLHTKNLAELLEVCLQGSLKQRSFLRKIFQQLRRQTRKQRKLKDFFFKRGLRYSMHLLVMSWKRLEVYCGKNMKNRRATNWIRRSRVLNWFVKWRRIFSLSRRRMEYCLQQKRRLLYRGMQVLRTNVIHSHFAEITEKKLYLKLCHFQTRRIFNSWKSIIQLQVCSIRKNHGTRNIQPLVVALRKREVQHLRDLEAASQKHLRTLFYSWKHVVSKSLIYLTDRAILLDSFVSQRQLRSSFRNWLNIYRSQSFHRCKSTTRLWQRWARYATRKCRSSQSNKTASMSFTLRRISCSMRVWVNFRERQRRLRETSSMLTKFMGLKILIRSLMGWKITYSLRCKKKSQEENAMAFYLANLRKRSWREWLQACQTKKLSASKKIVKREIKSRQDDGRGCSEIEEEHSEEETEDLSLILYNSSNVVLNFRAKRAIIRWISFARSTRRLRVAASLCSFKSQRRMLKFAFSRLLASWFRELQGRINESVSLAEGSSQFEQRSRDFREEYISTQSGVNKIKEHIDEQRTILAEMQQKFDCFAEECSSLEQELALNKNAIESVQQQERDQREIINGILLLCRGTSNAQPLEASHESILSHHLSQKNDLLSELEKFTTNTLTTRRYREREKVKLSTSIQEGLHIGRQYKNLLMTLSNEVDCLIDEMHAGEVCLGVCRQQLDDSLQRVAMKGDFDNQEISELNSEKLFLTHEYEVAIEEENKLREELMSLRSGTLSFDQIESGIPTGTIFASLNHASCSNNVFQSEKILAFAQTCSSIDRPIEVNQSVPFPIGSPLHIVNQLHEMRSDTNRRLTQVLSPPSVVASFDSISPDKELNKRIQNISGRIRERLKSFPIE